MNPGSRSNRWWWLWLLAFLAGCQGASDAPPPGSLSSETESSTVDRGFARLDVAVTPKAARLSDEVRLTIELAGDPGVELELPDFGDGIGDFTIRDLQRPALITRDGREMLRQQLTLEPTAIGRLEIDPIIARCRRADAGGAVELLRSKPLEVEVRSMIDPTDASLDDLRTLQSTLPEAKDGRAWIYLLPGSLLFVLAVFVVLFLRRQRESAAPPPLTPSQQANLELDALDAALPSLDTKTFYVRLTEIVRRFLEATTDVPAGEQTTDEFLRAIVNHKRFSTDLRQRLRAFLESADLVKFAAQPPSDDGPGGALRAAREFVREDNSGEAAR